MLKKIFYIKIIIFNLKFSFKNYLSYLNKGAYSLGNNSDILSKDDLSINTFEKYNKKNIVKKILLNYISKKKLIVKNDGDKFNGDCMLITSSFEQFKFIDFKNKKLLTKYLNREKYFFMIKNINYAKKNFNIPSIIDYNDEDFTIIESFMENERISTDILFRKIMEFYIENKFEEKYKGINCFNNIKKEINKFHLVLDELSELDILNFEYIKLHGDLWRSNVIFCDGNLYFIDFENICIAPFFYDIYFYIFSSAYIENDFYLLNNYIIGYYDELFSNFFEKYSCRYYSDKKRDYFMIFLKFYTYYKWSNLSKREMKNELNKLNKFINCIWRGKNE